MVRPRSKPRVFYGPADRHTGANESIVEIAYGGIGGLMSVRATVTGTLEIHLYRLDPGIEVTVSREGRGEIL